MRVSLDVELCVGWMSIIMMMNIVKKIRNRSMLNPRPGKGSGAVKLGGSERIHFLHLSGNLHSEVERETNNRQVNHRL